MAKKKAKKKKSKVILIRLQSTGKKEDGSSTGHCYYQKRNIQKEPEKRRIRKYDPVIRSHVEYKEVKMK